MNFSYFISKRLRKARRGSFTVTIHRIAIGSIGIGVAIMIISFFILLGFQHTVKDKLYGFSGHLQVASYTLGYTEEDLPVSNLNDFFIDYSDIDGIRHVQQYAYKAGLIRTKDEILGVVLKGIDDEFDQHHFEPNIVKGDFIKVDTADYSNEVVISQVIANQLLLDVGENIVVHFFQNPPRTRKLKIVGIYETNLSEYFDKKIIIADIGLIRRLNSWPDSLAGGFEVFLKKDAKPEEVLRKLDEVLDYELFIESIPDKFVQVFDWLKLISRQVNIFLGLILFVVCFNMVSVVLILIMERTQMIGMLKALGTTNRQIRLIFAYTGLQILGKGLLLGNVLGLVLCAIQYYLKVIPLDAKDYYMSYVPISWEWGIVLMVNVLTLVVVYVILAIPTLFIERIQAIRAIRFD